MGYHRTLFATGSYTCYLISIFLFINYIFLFLSQTHQEHSLFGEQGGEKHWHLLHLTWVQQIILVRGMIGSDLHFKRITLDASEQRFSNYGPESKPSQLSINQILLEHSHTHSFMYCQWLLSGYNGRVAVPLQKKFVDACFREQTLRGKGKKQKDRWKASAINQVRVHGSSHQ